MRALACLALLVSGAVSHAQVPDVRVKLDARLNYRTPDQGRDSLRLYDALGRPSFVSLTFYLEPGFTAYVSQRLQSVRNDTDNGLLDEYFIEDEGIWRVGRQYLPFGAGQLIRESVIGVRGDTSLIFERLPVQFVAYETGERLPSGVMARVGTRLGVSAAVGRHFAIGSGSLAVVRRPEDAPGEGRGYRRAYGVDFSRKSGQYRFVGESVWLEGGHAAEDLSTNVTDIAFSFDPDVKNSFSIGYSRRSNPRLEVFRLLGSFQVYRSVSFEPMIRVADGRFFDLNLGLRVKL